MYVSLRYTNTKEKKKERKKKPLAPYKIFVPLS